MRNADEVEASCYLTGTLLGSNVDEFLSTLQHVMELCEREHISPLDAWIVVKDAYETMVLANEQLIKSSEL